MTYFWHKIAEEKIAEANKQGKLDNLPGSGKPLKLEDDSTISEELRLSYKILKNAGYTPPELDTRKEINRIEDLLASSPDEKERVKALKRLSYLTTKLGVLKPQSALLDNHEYTNRIAEKLVRNPNKKKQEQDS